MKKQTILVFLFSLLVYYSSVAQDINQDKFMKETQQTSTDNGEITLAWWIPIEFWELTLKREQTLSELQMEIFINTLRPYVIFAVVDGKMGPFGGVNYVPYDSLASSIELTGSDGNTYRPIDSDELSSDIQNMLAIFKPTLKNMMGQLGENMNFFVFEDANEKGERVADPKIDGTIQLGFLNREFTWRLPLGSLLPLKKCPNDGELLDGSWSYCPWHGDKLVEQE